MSPRRWTAAAAPWSRCASRRGPDGEGEGKRWAGVQGVEGVHITVMGSRGKAAQQQRSRYASSARAALPTKPQNSTSLPCCSPLHPCPAVTHAAALAASLLTALPALQAQRTRGQAADGFRPHRSPPPPQCPCQRCFLPTHITPSPGRVTLEPRGLQLEQGSLPCIPAPG